MVKIQTRLTALCVALACSLQLPVQAADTANPNQAKIDELTKQKDLVKAEVDLLTEQNNLTKAKFAALPDGLGKAGTLTVEEGGKDKFHVAARTADAFEIAATKLVAEIKDQPGPITLVTDSDIAAAPFFLAQRATLTRISKLLEPLEEEMKKNPKPGVAEKEATKESVGAAIYAAGTALSQLQQIMKAVKTDKTLSFTDADIPEEFLLDLLVYKAPDKLVYPSLALENVLAGGSDSDFMKDLDSLAQRRRTLVTWAGTDKGRKEKISQVTAEAETFASALYVPDQTTKAIPLVAVLRGEATNNHLVASQARSLRIRIASKGGASLKTSAWWRNDRLYASGGAVVLYRVVDGKSQGQILKAGVVNAETAFVRISLD